MAHIPDMHRLGRVMLVLLLAAVTACSPIDRLKRAQESDSGTFSANLAAEYLAFAESEAELGHAKNSEFFARKGLRAAHDESPMPEQPKDWITDNAPLQMELRNARKRLMNVRSEFFTRVASQSVARAQMLYDCWVMQASERTDDDLALPCRGEFLGEVSQLEQIIDTLGPHPKVTLPARYTILFALGSAELDNDAAFTVQEVLAITRLYPLHTVEIVGHADRSGSEKRNLVLSTERAANVTQALIDAGIGAERIGFSAEGEDNPEIPTLDGIRRDRNRRVEIAVLPILPTPVARETAESAEDSNGE